MKRPETCSVCHQEVRHGWRDGQEAWWHRDPVDHHVILGRRFTAADKAEVERQRHVVRERPVKVNPEGFPLLYEIETYTAASVEHAALKKEIREADEDYVEAELEPVECRSTPLNLKGTTDVTMLDGRVRQVLTPGGCRTIINLAAKVGWDVERLTYSRGPYVGAKGGSLGVSDSVVLVVRGPVVDGYPTRGVGSWRDGKSDWVWLQEYGVTKNIGARGLITYMKEHPARG